MELYPKLADGFPLMGLRENRKGTLGFPRIPIQTQRTLNLFYNGASAVSPLRIGHLPGTGTLTPLLSPSAVSCPK